MVLIYIMTIYFLHFFSLSLSLNNYSSTCFIHGTINRSRCTIIPIQCNCFRICTLIYNCISYTFLLSNNIFYYTMHQTLCKLYNYSKIFTLYILCFSLLIIFSQKKGELLIPKSGKKAQDSSTLIFKCVG